MGREETHTAAAAEARRELSLRGITFGARRGQPTQPGGPGVVIVGGHEPHGAAFVHEAAKEAPVVKHVEAIIILYPSSKGTSRFVIDWQIFGKSAVMSKNWVM